MTDVVEPMFVPGEYATIVHSNPYLNGMLVKIVKVYNGTGYHPLIGTFEGVVYEFAITGETIKWPEPLLEKIGSKFTLGWEDCAFVPDRINQ